MLQLLVDLVATRLKYSPVPTGLLEVLTLVSLSEIAGEEMPRSICSFLTFILMSMPFVNCGRKPIVHRSLVQ